MDSLKQVCAAAEEYGVLLAVEGHVLSILDTPGRVVELIDAVGSDALRFNMDPVNFAYKRRTTSGWKELSSRGVRSEGRRKREIRNLLSLTPHLINWL